MEISADRGGADGEAAVMKQFKNQTGFCAMNRKRKMEKPYIIRQAEKQDIPRIAEIIVFGKRVAYRPIFENDYVSFNELRVVDLYEEYHCGQNRLDGMLVYDDGIVKGIINSHPKDDKTLEITDFYVEPFFVGQGIGTLLLAQMIRQAEQKGFRKIILWVLKDNGKARRFYEAKGFIDSGKRCIVEGTAKEDCCYEYMLGKNGREDKTE